MIWKRLQPWQLCKKKKEERKKRWVDLFFCFETWLVKYFGLSTYCCSFSASFAFFSSLRLALFFLLFDALFLGRLEEAAAATGVGAPGVFALPAAAGNLKGLRPPLDLPPPFFDWFHFHQKKPANPAARAIRTGVLVLLCSVADEADLEDLQKKGCTSSAWRILSEGVVVLLKLHLSYFFFCFCAIIF